MRKPPLKPPFLLRHSEWQRMQKIIISFKLIYASTVYSIVCREGSETLNQFLWKREKTYCGK